MDKALALISDRLSREIERHVETLLTNGDARVFRESMARSIIQHQATAYMLGKDSKRLDLDDQRTITAANRYQLQFLDSFTEQIAAGDYAGLDKQLRARALLYSGATKAPYSQGQTKGVPLPFYPSEGSPCRGACKCAWIIVKLAGEGNYDCTWQMQGTERHCTICPQRAAASPYRVRGGQFIG